MSQGVGYDMGHVLVGQVVHDLLAGARRPDQPGLPQRPQVLRHERLRHARRLRQHAHRVGPVGQQLQQLEA